MKKFLFLLIPIIAILSLHQYNDTIYIWPYHIEPVNPDKAKVIKNIDGDTIKVMVNGREETIRMLGVDTPETVHPSKPVEYYGKEASNFTKNMCPVDSTVYLTYDWDPRDKYDRLLAYVWYKRDGQWIMHNLNLIANGFAHAYTVFHFDTDYKTLFIEAERNARNKEYGLWNTDSNPQKEIDGNHNTTTQIKANQQNGLIMNQSVGDLKIIFVQFKGNDEYVEIKNYSKTPIPLEGYKLISTEGNQTYEFEPIILSPSESIEIHSGIEATENIWSFSNIHNNNGDGVTLEDPTGKLISYYFW
ncbi:MAG TPA: thermonuclease family protein [Thermotogota bacterium]|nr:thermonuclease family protein [Thermotogota bacterium]HPR95035.1 thermonuclease family protein [Thermotogota bacterium]